MFVPLIVLCLCFGYFKKSRRVCFIFHISSLKTNNFVCMQHRRIFFFCCHYYRIKELRISMSFCCFYLLYFTEHLCSKYCPVGMNHLRIVAIYEHNLQIVEAAASCRKRQPHTSRQVMLLSYFPFLSVLAETLLLYLNMT